MAQTKKRLDERTIGRLPVVQYFAASSTGNDTYAITLDPAPTAYETGRVYEFKADVANTGTASLNVNGLGAKTIKNGTNDLVTGDIQAGAIISCRYDGTYMQAISGVDMRPSNVKTVEAGETLAVNDFIFINTADSKAYKASQNISTYANAWNTCGVVTSGGTSGSMILYQTPEGEYTYSSAHGFTLGATLYLGTGGALTETKPKRDTSTIVPAIIAIAVTSTRIQFRMQKLARYLIQSVNPTYSSPTYTDVTVNAGFQIGSVEAWGIFEGSSGTGFNQVYNVYDVYSSKSYYSTISGGVTGVGTSTSAPFAILSTGNPSGEVLRVTVTGTSAVFRATAGASSADVTAMVRINEAI